MIYNCGEFVKDNLARIVHLFRMSSICYTFFIYAKTHHCHRRGSNGERASAGQGVVMTIFYTGRGDKGKSAMGARKIAKDDPLFEALGALDELNSWLGFCQYKKLRPVQEDLFIAQAEIGAIGMRRKSKIQMTNAKTKRLEKEIAKVDAIVPPIKKFIIPGASELSAKLDVARALARRAERAAVKIKASPDLLAYLNRLSSFLFALARLVNFKLNRREEHPTYRP